MNKLKRSYGFGLIEILIVLVIICILVSIFLKRIVKQPIEDKQVRQVAAEQGIDTSNAKTVIDSTRNKLNEISEKQQQQNNQMPE